MDPGSMQAKMARTWDAFNASLWDKAEHRTGKGMESFFWQRKHNMPQLVMVQRPCQLPCVLVSPPSFLIPPADAAQEPM